MEEKKQRIILNDEDRWEIENGVNNAIIKVFCDKIGFDLKLFDFKLSVLGLPEPMCGEGVFPDITMSVRIDKIKNFFTEWIYNNERVMEFTDDKCLEYVSRLTEMEQQVISMRFSLGEYNRRYTLQEVGETMMIDRERVGQIEAKALRKMRNYVELNLSSEEYTKYLEDRENFTF